MRLVTKAEPPPYRVTLVTTPKYPDHRTLYLEPRMAMEIADINALLPGEWIQIRLWGDRRPITYDVRVKQICLIGGLYIEQINLYLKLLFPKRDRTLDARLVSRPAQSNVARISVIGFDRTDQYGPIPGLSRNEFTRTAQLVQKGLRLVHTPPQSA